MRTIEYLTVTILTLLFAAWVATTAIQAVSKALDKTANLIDKGAPR